MRLGQPQREILFGHSHRQMVKQLVDLLEDATVGRLCVGYEREAKTSMNGRLEGFLSCLNATTSVQETWSESVLFIKSLGFDLVEYGYVGFGTAVPEIEVETLSNFPAVYQDRYRQEQYFRHDPVVHHCISNLAPLRVGRAFLDLWPDRGRGLTAIQCRIVNEAADCGMAVGVVIPLRSPGRYPLGGMSLSNAMRPAEFEPFFAERGQTAHLAALYAHTRLQMQLQAHERAVSGVILSSRERECLLWIARGLSSKETAQRINLSAKTVDFHIANAMNKLGGATRSHAVARAIALGLLQP